MANSPPTTADGDDLATPVQTVIDDCVRRRVQGEVLSDDAVIAANTNLLPDLADELQKLRVDGDARNAAARVVQRQADTVAQTESHAGSGRLEVRCPHCSEPMEVAVDTHLTDLTCASCGSHFSLVDQSQATRFAPPLSKLGRFELIERIGMGGFGSVWKARDKELDRTVAIKIPRQGGMTPEEQTNFFREARAAAQLRHPRIVGVHEVGREGDCVYIVSDFVRGVTLGDWLTDQKLTSREAAELCAKIADALHHAHEQGVVHRDLKPANIMMDYDGEPHLMDFGLARRMAGEVTLTIDGQVIGTPAYMSPEQALGEAHTADRRSDVYSLGVILFQLLTNELPFRGNARMLIKHVAHDEPPSPRQFNAKIPKDLETITLKCLEKNPSQRYETAGGLAEELGRFLTGEPIHARPISQFAHAWRWARRNPTRVMAIVTAVLMLWTITSMAGMYLVNIQRNKAIALQKETERERGIAVKERDNAKTQEQIAQKARDNAKTQEGIATQERDRAKEQEGIATQERDRANDERQKREYEAYIAQIGLTSAKINENAFEFALQLLAGMQPELRNWEWGRLDHLCHLDAGTFDAEGPVQAVDYAPDGKSFVTGDRAGMLTVRDAQTGEKRFEVPHESYVLSVDYSPDGKQIASGSSGNTIKVIDAADGHELKTLPEHTDGVLTVRFSPDGSQLLSGSLDKTARLWDLATGKVLQTFQGNSWWIWAAEFSPDGNRIVTAGQDGKAIVWQKKIDPSRRPDGGTTTVRNPLYIRRAEFTDHKGAIYTAQFSPNGDLVATGGYDKQVMIWNPDEVRPIDIKAEMEGGPQPTPTYLRLPGHEGAVRSVAFSPNGNLLVSGSEDNSLRVWDVAEGKNVKTLRGHGSAVRSCIFSPDGDFILAGDDRGVRRWDLTGYEEARVLHATVFSGHEDAVLSARFSRDGEQIVTASRDRSAALWDAESGRPLQRFSEGHDFLVTNAAFFPDGRLATAAGDNSARIWSTAEGVQLAVLSPTGRIGALAVSPDGKGVATSSIGNDVQIWSGDATKTANTAEKPVALLSGHSRTVAALAFSAKGDRLASGDDMGRIRLWAYDVEAKKWGFERELVGHNDAIMALRFTPDGGKLISASGDRTCAQWDLTTGNELRELVLKHPRWVSSLDITSDGARVVTTCDDGVARIWRLKDATQIAATKSDGNPFNTAGFSPDGGQVVLTAAADKKVQLWDMAAAVNEPREGNSKKNIQGSQSVSVLLDFSKSGGELWSAQFAPDGEHLLTVGGNDAQLWDVATRRPVVGYSPHGAVTSADISPDGKLVASASWDHSAKIWSTESGRSIRKLDRAHNGYINSVEFSPDGQQLLTASDDHTARLWDVVTGKPIGNAFEGHKAGLFGATYSLDATRILTVSGDNTARIWDRASGKSLTELVGHTLPVLLGRFSSDGSRVITGSRDKSAIIWNAETGERILELTGHTAAVTSVAFSPDGTRALTGSQDNLAKLWDAATGKEILSLPGHTQEVTSVSFSPDGRSLLTSSRDGTAIIWLASDWRESNLIVTPANPPTKRPPRVPAKPPGEQPPSAPSPQPSEQPRPEAPEDDDLFGQDDSAPRESAVSDRSTQRTSQPSDGTNASGPTSASADPPGANSAKAETPPYFFEGFLEAKEAARRLKVVLARMHNDQAGEIAAWQEFKEAASKRHEYVRALYESGRSGGEAYIETYARCRYHLAEAELATLRGQREVALKSWKLALLAARERLDVTRARYEEGKGDVSLDFYLQARENLFETIIRIVDAGGLQDPESRQLIHPSLVSETDIRIDALLKRRDAYLDAWRATYGLWAAGRVGGEAYQEAIARAYFFAAATDLAEFVGEQRALPQSEHPIDVSLPTGNSPKGTPANPTAAREYSELAARAGANAFQYVQIRASEGEDWSHTFITDVLELSARLQVAHANRIGDHDAMIDALVSYRNAQLVHWRRIRALYEIGRLGGEAEQEASARAEYFESLAKLLETVANKNLASKKYDDVVAPPPGMLPVDWIAKQSEFANRSVIERTYRNALHARQEQADAWNNSSQEPTFSDLNAHMVPRYLELVAYAPDGSEIGRFDLKEENLADLRKLFATLPDGKYRIFFVRTDIRAKRLVLDLYVRGGRMIDPADDSEGARDRIL